MRLVTHNLMACVQCQHFPLDISVTDLAPVEAEFDSEFTRKTLARIEYSYLVDAFASVKTQCPAIQNAADLPRTVEELDLSDNSAHLKAVHYALCAIAVKNGGLQCSACGTKYTIKEFIPNMMAAP